MTSSNSKNSRQRRTAKSTQQIAPIPVASPPLQVSGMSTRNRPARPTRNGTQKHANQAVEDEPNSATLPAIETQEILETYDKHESMTAVSALSKGKGILTELTRWTLTSRLRETQGAPSKPGEKSPV